MAIPRVLQALRDLRAKDTSQDTVINNLRDSQLVGKYYIPTVSILMDTPVVSTVNPLPRNSWVEDPNNNKRYTNGGYAIETDLSISNINRNLPAAFDGTSTTFFESYLSVPYIDNPVFIITLPTELKITKMRYNLNSPDIISVVISGSPDKTSWTTLHTNSDVSTVGFVEVTLDTPRAFKYYRVQVNRAEDNVLRLYELQIAAYEIINYTAQLRLADIPDNLSINQRLLIKVPDYDITGVSQVTLNDVAVDAIVTPNKYYELMYDGTRYLTREVL